MDESRQHLLENGPGAKRSSSGDASPDDTADETADNALPTTVSAPADTADPDPDATAADAVSLEGPNSCDTGDLQATGEAVEGADTSDVEVPSQLLAPVPLSCTEEETLAFERRILGTKLAGCIVDARIGRGAVGSVFRARHVGLEKDVAVKILNPALFCLRRHVDQFFCEARAAASLEHENIVTVYDVGQHRGLYYIVMQLIKGETMGDLIDRDGKIEVTEAIRMTIEAAKALGAAHDKGIVHRDIKPANLLLTREGRIKVADFGLASRLEEGGEANGKSEVAGTPYYIPPEQIAGGNVDNRADLYSLGVTLYYAVTGKRPFDGATPRDILVKHLTQVPPAVNDVDPTIPVRLSHIIARLLAKRPRSRPSSAEEVIDELNDLAREMAW